MNNNDNIKNKRCLWRHRCHHSGDNDANSSVISEEEKHQDTDIDNKETYESILKQFTSRPPAKTLVQLISNSLVVVQEVCLTCYLLARHRITAAAAASSSSTSSLSEDNNNNDDDNLRVERSTIAMYVALLLVLAYSSSNKAQQQQQQQSRKTKIRQRFMDGIFLAVLLRFLASLLQSLTASYSSDTVQSLAQTMMVLHVVTCDYSYANGNTNNNNNAVVVGKGDDNHDNKERGHHQQQQQKTTTTTTIRRPSFRGGTISLNAALFSTTLLVSRLSSSLSAYFYVSTTIVIFAFYPVTRNAITASYPPNSNRKYIITFNLLNWLGRFFLLLVVDAYTSSSHKKYLTRFIYTFFFFSFPAALWLITAAIFVATALLLDSIEEVLLLVGILLLVGMIIPCWKYITQTEKRLVRGPWDIPRLNTMQLDYRIQTAAAADQGTVGKKER